MWGDEEGQKVRRRLKEGVSIVSWESDLYPLSTVFDLIKGTSCAHYTLLQSILSNWRAGVTTLK